MARCLSSILALTIVAAAAAGAVQPSRADSHLASQAEEPSAEELLDRLFGQLRQAEDEASAKTVEQAIWKLWMRSGSPTTDLLVEQAEKAIQAKEYGIAINMLGAAIELEPEFPEVWNRRATAYYLDRQYERSIADVERVLELEPRHFAALAGLGVMRRQMGDDRAAYEAFRRALAIHPYLPTALRAVKQLQMQLEQDI